MQIAWVRMGGSHHGHKHYFPDRKRMLERTYQNIRRGARRGPAPEGDSAMKIPRAHGGCLGTGSRRRTRQAAIIRGEGHTPFDPRVSEWGNPGRAMPAYPSLNKIGERGTTRGTETSKYPEEEKSTEIAGVAASETAQAQTHARVSVRALPHGGRGSRTRGAAYPGGVTKQVRSGTAWKGRPQRVRAPYANRSCPRADVPSRPGQVQPGPKLGGPPSKAKHSPVTDSEPVP